MFSEQSLHGGKVVCVLAASLSSVVADAILPNCYLEYVDSKIEENGLSDRWLRPSWIDVDLNALAGNCRRVKAMVGAERKMMAVVKANGYGHGAVSVAQVALKHGAEFIGVASVGEALDLREAGIDKPILVLTYICPEAIPQIIRQNITISVFDLEHARQFNQVAHACGADLRIHLKIDSGMGRLGIMPEAASQFLHALDGLTHLKVEGIYTHFAVADEDPIYTNQQVATFKHVVRSLQAQGFQFDYIHCSNSAGILLVQDDLFNMVRPGLLLYGLSPSRHIPCPPGFQELITWKTTVVQVREMPPNYPIGYGNTYFTGGQERVAILPVGYADGLRRSPTTWREVLVHGRRAPLIGRVSMEKIAVNVSDIPDVKIGDEVVLLGKQGDQHITVDEVAEWLGTINYEIITTIMSRAPRQ